MQEIRFTKLVEKSGKPEPALLWTEPKKNRPFMQAVKQNRVLTVVQQPTGTQKDFGLIGFHEQQFALYLVFPRRLPKPGDAKVIGIHYDVIDPPAPKAKADDRRETTLATSLKKSKSAKLFKPAKPAAPKPAPIAPKQFQVEILRVATENVTFTVTAKDIKDAEQIALKKVSAKKFQVQEVQAEIKAIAQI